MLARFPVLFLLTALCLSASPVAAQDARPALGIGFNTVLSSTEGLGVGIRGRAAWPVNADLSFAAGAGITGFILEGRDEASYVFDPQASVIVTLNSTGVRTPYIIGGIGAALHVDTNSTAESGPTLHFGVGWVQGLRDTTLFYELNPALLVGKDELAFMIPFRVGVIF